jgi:hypothetical protein
MTSPKVVFALDPAGARLPDWIRMTDFAFPQGAHGSSFKQL